MRSYYFALLTSAMVVVSTTALSDDRTPFYGNWGSEKQCARQPILPNGTFLAEPFTIGSEWFKHGQLSCNLTWFPVGKRKDGTLFTNAQARCGEDSVRNYLMRFTLKNNNALTISWDLTTKQGPLKQCPAS